MIKRITGKAWGWAAVAWAAGAVLPLQAVTTTIPEGSVNTTLQLLGPGDNLIVNGTLQVPPLNIGPLSLAGGVIGALADNSTITVGPTGRIIATASSGPIGLAGPVIGLGNNTTINNAGLIQGTGSLLSVGTVWVGDNFNLTNSGQIIADGGPFNLGVGAVALRGTSLFGLSFGNYNITNSGTIRATGVGTLNIPFLGIGELGASIGLLGVGNGVITNTGTIAASNSLFSAGVLAFGDSTTLINSGVIQSNGTQVPDIVNTLIQLIAPGFELPFQGAPAVLVVGDGVIVNTGSIIAHGPNSDGIVVTGNGTITNTSLNSITATANGIKVDGLAVIDNSGRIDVGAGMGAGILTGAFNDTITNSGIIIGGLQGGGIAINTGGGNDVINLLSGTVLGAVQLGAGDDRINLLGPTMLNRPIEGGAGSDALNVALPGLSKAAFAALASNAGFFYHRGLFYSWHDIETTSSQGSFSFEESGRTYGQRSFGRSLDNLSVFPTGEFAELVSVFDNGGPAAFPGLADQVLPRQDAAWSTLAFANADFQGRNLDRYLTAVKQGVRGLDTSGLTLLDGTLDPRMAQLGQLLANASLSHQAASDVAGATLGGVTTASSKNFEDAKKLLVPVHAERRLGAFVAGTGIFGDGDETDNSAFDYTTGGVTVGVDYLVTDNFVVGILGGYAGSNLDYGSLGETDVDTYTVGLYSSYFPDEVPGLYVNGAFTYSWNDYENNRNIAIPGFGSTATSSPEGDQYLLRGIVGYDWQCGHFTVGPFAGVQYVNWQVDGYNESGAGILNLNVNEQETESLKSILGARFAYDWVVNPETRIVPEFRASWLHEFRDNARLITSSLNAPGLAPFALSTADAEGDTALLGVSVSGILWDQYTVFLSYDAQVGQSDFSAQQVTGGVRATF